MRRNQRPGCAQVGGVCSKRYTTQKGRTLADEEQIPSVNTGEIRIDLPPDGVHLWVFNAVFVLDRDIVEQEARKDGNEKWLPLEVGNEDLVVVSPPHCFKCGETPEDTVDMPCVGARGRRRSE